MLPFHQPPHVGYCISCYDEDGPIFSIPISASTTQLRQTLGKQWPIDATPLTREELEAVYPFVIGYISIGWSEKLEYYIVGSNLPPGWE
ncbi:MAG: hypothetical protein EOP87_06300 [Verrucomicrobiaceae bacterium]|nr:MAG: hypothetical protein EOP87_06300 [Verrucomicrobiaceae bacterium]